MIAHIPVYILLGAAIFVIVLQFVPRGLGLAWLASVLFAVAAWVATILLRTQLPLSFAGQYWKTLGIENRIPAFQMDIITWPFALIVCSLVTGVLLVSSARIGLDSNPKEWAGILIVGSLGYLGVTATNILTAMLILASIDLVEIVILFFSLSGQININSEIRNILWRLTGLTIFLAALGWQYSLTGISDDWRILQSGPVNLILVACAIRLQILPISLLIGAPRFNQNGFLVLRNLVGILAVFAIIIQLPFHAFSLFWNISLLVYLLVTAFVSSIQVLRNKNAEGFLVGWQMAAGSLICATFIMGYSVAGMALSLSISVLGAILMLGYPISIFSRVLGLLAIVGFCGLPLTPNVTGFSGFGLSRDFPGILFLIPVSLLIYSSIQIILNKPEIVNNYTERWSRIISPIGLIFPLISSWLIYINGIANKDIFQISIPAFIAVFLVAAAFINSKFKIIEFNSIKNAFLQYLQKRIISNKFALDIYHNIIKTLFPSPINSVINLFEGEGGVLWSVLSLVLIITIIRTLGFTP